MNFIPSIIYVQILILWSLKILTLGIIVPLILPTSNVIGIEIIHTIGAIIPGQPNLNTRIIITTIRTIGVDVAVKKKTLFN